MKHEHAVCLDCRMERACRIFTAFDELVAMCEVCLDKHALAAGQLSVREEIDRLRAEEA